MTGVGLGGLGAVIGAVVGSLTRSDRWISVPLGSAEATPRLQVGRGRAGLGWSCPFSRDASDRERAAEVDVAFAGTRKDV